MRNDDACILSDLTDCESAKFPHACLLSERSLRGAGCNASLTCYQAARGDPAALQKARSCSLAADAPRSALPLLAVSAAWAAEDADNTVILTTKHGKVTIKLHPDWAPKTVAQFKTLVKDKFYDGLDVPSRHSGLHGPDRRSDRHRRRAARSCPTCRPSSTRPISSAASSAWRAPTIRIPPIRSSSSCSATAGSSTANTPPSARSRRGWTPSTRSRREPRATTARSTIPTRS